MPISHGIEFEFDFVDRRDRMTSNRTYLRDAYYVIDNWRVQHDPTAGAEIKSPIFTSVSESVREIKNEFEAWMEVNQGWAPLMYSRSGRSLGQHIHIGTVIRGVPRRFRRSTKEKIARAIAEFYPYLMSIHANPLPSHRGLGSMYCHSLYEYIIEDDHYCEISDSCHGTVECRVFDANIPQVSLTCIWLMRKIASKVVRDNNIDVYDFNFDWYRRERRRALRDGLIALNLPEYFEKLVNFIGNQRLTESNDCPRSVKEILYLSVKYRHNPYVVFRDFNIRPYDYFSTMPCEPDKYLELLFNITPDLENQNRISRWMEEVDDIRDLNDLLEIARESQRYVRRLLEERRREEMMRFIRSVTRMSRSEVRERLERVGLWIRRINDVRGMSTMQVARTISYLLKHHGEGMVNEMSPEDVINCPERFYVAYTIDREGRTQILGAIAIRVATGEVCHLVVNRRYRRLGIARDLVRFVRRSFGPHGLITETPRLWTYIRKENEASQRLFESLGFRRITVKGRSYRYEFIQEGED